MLMNDGSSSPIANGRLKKGFAIGVFSFHIESAMSEKKCLAIAEARLET